jgi:membrane protease YdiL (CAAX protease family)
MFASRVSEKGVLGTYLDQSRNWINCLVLVAPLFVIYQIGILFTHGWKNGADFVTPRLLSLTRGDRLAYSLINLAVLAFFVVLFFILRRRRTLHPRTWAIVLVESCLYAFALGGVAARILFAVGLSPPMSGYDAAASPSPPAHVVDAIILSIGAGAYEEMFFRLLLVGGLVFILGKAGMRRWLAWLIAIAASSIVFSVFHYVPIGIESWQLWSFAFRLLLGVLLAFLFVTRGFAVAVYTHALYDILILVPRALGLDG